MGTLTSHNVITIVLLHFVVDMFLSDVFDKSMLDKQFMRKT